MKKILLLLMSITTLNVAFAQRTLTGTVTAANGEPVVGASIVVKNTSNGTVADLDGKYSLGNVPADAKTLVFSSIGFTSKDVEIGASNVIDATLEEGSALSEVVVTAFGIKKDRSNLGYGVSQVTAQELTQAHTTNLTNALAAKVPGVRLSGSGGSFSSSSITIRGMTSFTGSNQPLIVIDGVTVDNSGGGNTLQTGVTNSSRAIDINQEDIESMSVLKGASATALYGSRAANGVILITTKSGNSKSKQSITYSAVFANQEVNRLPDYQNVYGQGNTGAFNPGAVASWGPKMDGRTVLLPLAYRGLNLLGQGDNTTLTAFPNNVSDLFQIGSNQQHNLSFQGGNDKNTYRLSLGYLNDVGVLSADKLQRYNLGLNANSQITKKLSAGISFNYIRNTSTRSPQGNQLSNPLFRTWAIARSWDLTNMPYKSATGANMHYDPNGTDNPRWTLENNLYNDQVDRMYGNFNLNYNLTDWLTARFKAGADNYTFSGSYYDQIGAAGGASGAGGVGGIRDVRNVSQILNSTVLLEATKKVGDVDLTVVLGNEVLHQERNDNDITGLGVTVRNFRNLANNTTTYYPTYERWQYRLVGFFANVTAAYKGWANLDVAFRNDQNSILPVANNSYSYYSVAGMINPLKMLNIESKVVSGLKIRANTGLVGSAKQEFRFNTATYYTKSNPSDGFGPNIQFPYNTLAGFTYRNTAGNPNFKPEFTRSSEVGVELSLWKDRIVFNGTIYRQKSTDVILAVPNSSAAGISAVVTNAGSLTTNGKELSLTVAPLKSTKKGGLNWSTTFNYTQFKTIVDELAPGVPNIVLAGFTTPNIRLVAGDEYGQIYGSDYVRDVNGKMVVNSVTGLPSPTANVTKIGNPNPKYILGISNNFSFKGFSLNVLLDIKKGGDQYSRNIADLQRNGVAAETAAIERLDAAGAPAKVYKFDAVKADGTPNDIMITAEQYWGNAGKYVAAKGFIYNTDWFRVREVSLNYDIPTAFIKNTVIGSLSLGFFGRNLFLSAPNYPHLDPEQNVLGVSNAQGLEFNALPQTKTMGFNLKATF